MSPRICAVILIVSGTWAAAQSISQPRAKAEAERPGTIHGSRTPNLIPTQKAYSLYFRSLLPLEGENNQHYDLRLLQAERRSGLADGDAHALEEAIAAFRNVLVPAERAAGDLQRNGGAGAAGRLAGFQAARTSFVNAQIERLFSELSPQGAARMRSFMDREVKTHITYIPGK